MKGVDPTRARAVVLDREEVQSLLDLLSSFSGKSDAAQSAETKLRKALVPMHLKDVSLNRDGR